MLAEARRDGIYAYEDPRVHLVRSGGDEHFVMSYTNLPPPETHEFWRIGVHLLDVRGRALLARPELRPRDRPPGEPDKDGIVFNLADGRVALIHRIYPNMQLAVFDSLEQLCDPPAGYWEAHMADLDRHTIIRPGDNVARRRRRCAAGGHRRRAAAALPRAGRARALQHEGGAARSRDRPGEGDADEPIMRRSSSGSGAAT